MLYEVQNLLGKINRINDSSKYDFRKYAYPQDELEYLFEEWVSYYKLKYSICKAIKPKTILEIGVRYGYSAITFLNASPRAKYLGIDNDSDSYGGSVGGINWAKKTTQNYNAEFLISDTQKMVELPGEEYDFIHIDGQQDGDGTFHDLEMALEKGKYILVDGYFWSTENMLSSTYFIKKYKDYIQSVIIIPGYAGEFLIKTKKSSQNIFNKYKKKNYSVLQENYDTNYYLNDCGGYDVFCKTSGVELDDRLSAVYTLIDSKKNENILDVGSGRGELSFILSQNGANVLGLDYSEKAIEISKKTFQKYIGSNLNFKQADILKFDNDTKFDKIVASDIVEHLEQPSLEKMIEKLSGLLKEDGNLILHTAPNKLNYRYQYPKRRMLAKKAGTYIPSNPRTFYEDLMHINEQTPGKLNRLLKKHFKYSITWVSDLPDLVGSLCGEFSKSQIMKSSSIFAIASNKEIKREEIYLLLIQDKLDKEDMNIKISSSIDTLDLNESEVIDIPITINNKSHKNIASFQPYPINISYHWLNDNQEMQTYDGIRTRINIPISAGTSRNFSMKVKVPDKKGKYNLQITMVQEECFWFEDILADFPININVTVK